MDYGTSDISVKTIPLFFMIPFLLFCGQRYPAKNATPAQAVAAPDACGDFNLLTQVLRIRGGFPWGYI